MLRDTWLAEDGVTVVRTAHRLLVDQKDMIIVYDLNKNSHHAEHHDSITTFLPKDTRLMVSQGDIVSLPEWRLSDTKGRVLASFIRLEDGMIVPRTRAMFDADQKEREAKLSKK